VISSDHSGQGVSWMSRTLSGALGAPADDLTVAADRIHADPPAAGLGGRPAGGDAPDPGGLIHASRKPRYIPR
jgi:hypothetical protein